MKTIKLNLSVEGIQNCINEVEKYKANVVKNTEKLKKELAEQLQIRAQALFNVAIADRTLKSEKPAEVTVTTEENGNTLVVVANGEDAVWAEFGTGIYYNGVAGTSPHPKGRELGFTIGSYGKGLGKRSVWGTPDGELTHGVEASMPMYNAFLELREDIVNIAKEVFDKND